MKVTPETLQKLVFYCASGQILAYFEGSKKGLRSSSIASGKEGYLLLTVLKKVFRYNFCIEGAAQLIYWPPSGKVQALDRDGHKIEVPQTTKEMLQQLL
jgi:hypothetical protein